MEIVKVLNNNVVLARDIDHDYIIIGGGIGFNKKKGSVVPEEKIERKFIAFNSVNMNQFARLLEDIPTEYANISNKTIMHAKDNLNYEFSNTIYISLTDHLYNLVKLARDGIKINNPLTREIKKFYNKEYNIGAYAIEILINNFDVEIAPEEAGNIALHFINAQISNSEVDNISAVEVTKKIRDIIELVRMNNKIEIDEKSLSFDRFVTHLRFFFQRLDNKVNTNDINPLLSTVIEKYPQAYETTKIIEKYLEVNFSDDERLYLTLHIEKLIESK